MRNVAVLKNSQEQWSEFDFIGSFGKPVLVRVIARLVGMVVGDFAVQIRRPRRPTRSSTR